MKKYLVDVNLPYRFSLWYDERFLHQRDVGEEWKDNRIWDYARENKLTLITKDCDFSNKIMFSSPPPRVIHIRLGNMRLKQLYHALSENWEEVLSLSESYKLVNVFADRIEGID